MRKGAEQRSAAIDHRVEVAVADADVVLNDACDVLLSGQRSQILRAVDASTAILVMSDRAFHELGWMSAKAARGRGVDDAMLRDLIETEYLPRVPVVATKAEVDGHWLPSVDDVRDVHDVPHVQVARLISARLIYSHDRHLRSPGFAPKTRPAFDRRMISLADFTTGREIELGAGLALGAGGLGAERLVSKAASSLSVRREIVWAVLSVAVAAVAADALRGESRRKRVVDTLRPWAVQLGGVLQRAAAAGHELGSTQFAVAPDQYRLEARLATFLVRNPGKTATQCAEALAVGRPELLALLRAHPAFELQERWRWSVGRARTHLVTLPRLPMRPA